MATFGTFTSGQTLTAAELNSAGAYQSYTPTWTQSATITKTVNWARYTLLNKLVIGSIKMTASSAGTSNNKVLVGLPVAASADNFIIGKMVLFDDSQTSDSVSDSFLVFCESSTTMSFYVSHFFSSTAASITVQTDDLNYPTTDVRLGQNYTTIANTARTGFAVASGDIMWIQFMYEAA